MVVEEGEWLAGFHGFEPKGKLAQLDRHWVDVHAVDAAANDIAQSVAQGGGRRFVFAGADGGEASGDAVGGSDQEVPGAAGFVADLESKHGLLGE